MVSAGRLQATRHVYVFDTLKQLSSFLLYFYFVLNSSVDVFASEQNAGEICEGKAQALCSGQWIDNGELYCILQFRNRSLVVSSLFIPKVHADVVGQLSKPKKNEAPSMETCPSFDTEMFLVSFDRRLKQDLVGQYQGGGKMKDIEDNNNFKHTMSDFSKGNGKTERFLFAILMFFIFLTANTFLGIRKSPECSFTPDPPQLQVKRDEFQLETVPRLRLSSQTDFESLRFIEPLGSGSFKTVYRGMWGATNVAIACMRKGGVLHEARLLQNLAGHPNLVTFYKWTADLQGTEYLVMELLPMGPLAMVLRKHSYEISIWQKISMCAQICQAMEHLSSQHIVHRDLAARNVLVQSLNPISVKVSDFGLAKCIYSSDKISNQSQFNDKCTFSDMLPLRWVSPEVIKTQLWSEKSDVWAFGITMWEIFNNGSEPYISEFSSDVDVVHHVLDGGQLTKPANCPDIVFEIMQQCWKYDSDVRPSFQDLSKQFIELEARLDFIKQDATLESLVGGVSCKNLVGDSIEVSMSRTYAYIQDIV